ncbi:glycosyltransferase [Algoriphagus sp. SE2]|uniref:glycosyltransferase n=1 Tax=Algoriphagus sp. SE2 TaxID=3141536 RepID=UPI0031CD3524
MNSSLVQSNCISLFEDGEAYEGITYLSQIPRLKAFINNWIERKIHKYDSSKFGLYTYGYLGTDVSRMKVIQDADVIYIHWVQLGFFNNRSFEKLFETDKKIFIVLHDMWFMTGGCHYAVDCEQFIDGCLNCPIFKDKSIASSQHRKKEKLISKYKGRFEFITPSLWLKNLGGKSSLLKDSIIHFIPNYFESPNFKPSSQSQARSILSIDPKKLVVCFGAVNISSVYKGWMFINEAFKYLKNSYSYDELEVVIFGNGDLSEFEKAIDFKIHYLGYLEDEKEISLAYKCADVFVIPSILDNQPTTIVESLHCGIPVVGFDLCGIPEMIEHKKTGYIAEAYNSVDLADGIKFCLENKLQVTLKEEYKSENVLKSHFKLLNIRDSNG